MPKKYVANGIRIECITTPDGVLIDFLIELPGITYHAKTVELLRRLRRKGHVVSMDRLYTSISLCDVAMSMQQHICGTVRSDRGFPTSLQTAACRGTTAAYAWEIADFITNENE